MNLNISRDIFESWKHVVTAGCLLLSICAFDQADADEKEAELVNRKVEFPRNYDEIKVPPYHLPDLLVAEDGTVIDTPKL